MVLRCKRGEAVVLEVRVSDVLLARARREAAVGLLIAPASAMI